MTMEEFILKAVELEIDGVDMTVLLSKIHRACLPCWITAPGL